jgi:hypothetical protein
MKKLIAIALCGMLAGCSGTTQVITKPEYVVRPPIQLPEPEPVNQLPLEWAVITQKNLEQRLKELKGPNGDVVVFALTPEDYQSLSLNAAELRRYIQALRAYMKIMRDYYERPIQPSEQPKNP